MKEENEKYQSMDDFVDDCVMEGMENFFAFAGDGVSKRACIGVGEEEAAIVTIAAVFLDRPDIRQMFQTAIRMAIEVENEDKNIN